MSRDAYKSRYQLIDDAFCIDRSASTGVLSRPEHGLTVFYLLSSSLRTANEA